LLLYVKEKIMKEIYQETKGYRIRLARKAIGLTQTQLARKVKTTQQTIHDYEKNKRGSYADTNLLINISMACAVTLDWLLTGKDWGKSQCDIPILSSPKQFLTWFKQNKSEFYKKRMKVGFYLEDDSMTSQTSNSFKANDIIIVLPSKSPVPNDYVIAIDSANDSSVLFRQLLREENHYLLKPLNASYSNILLEPPIKTIAVVIEQHKLLCQ
jgi:transcriptional regulator with XRE-family HTH domain